VMKCSWLLTVKNERVPPHLVCETQVPARQPELMVAVLKFGHQKLERGKD